MRSRVGPRLEPETDVARNDGRFQALTREPWLGLSGLPIARIAGRFVEVTYSASLWDEPVRPIFRFWQDDGTFVDHLAAGPILGTGLWTGRVPRNTTRVSVSPTNRPGPFDFCIDSVRSRSWLALLAQGFDGNPKSARSAVVTRLIGWAPESDVNLAWATGSVPLARYETWRGRRERSVDLLGLDRPRFDWSRSPPIRLLVLAEEAHAEALRITCASLETQVFPHWRAFVVSGGSAPIGDPRFNKVTRDAAADTIAAETHGSLTGVLRAGDVLPVHALASLAEQAHRYPDGRLFYGDVLQRDHEGVRIPAFSPGWSPRLQATLPYLRSPTFVRDIAAWTSEERRQALATGAVPASIIEALAVAEVRPLRRIMVETGLEVPPLAPRATSTAAVDATALVVIPTRDHPAMLRRAIASIRRKSRPGSFRIAVADNGSADLEAIALLAKLRKDPDVVVIDRPGPFNFSAICNAAAATVDGDVLVFLNDDTEVLSEGWLDRLITHALSPATGAVGGKLTYPDGRIQHVGVLVGMGQSAGHFGALTPADDPGWAGRNEAVHEVAAVTGACLAVAREKFDAVGGFDSEHLPIELSDVDLCLKLNERGWQTIVDPAVHLLHEESASRGGATFRRLDLYASQRAVFVERWRHVLRDDPTFHPGLSLYSSTAALG